MKKSLIFFSALIALLLGMSLHVLSSEAASPQQSAAPVSPTSQPLCSTARHGYAHCLALRAPSVARPHRIMQPNGIILPSGFAPADLQKAYNLPSLNKGAGQKVAIVDAYDAPNAEADLAVYRSTYGLSSCTTANGCFQKVDQNGGRHYPAADEGWAAEISLDLAMVSAICPRCHILLVEANDASFGNLSHAVDTAASLKANAISNSYGGDETLWDALITSRSYNHSGIAITASAGDNGYGVSMPASFSSVIAVGGTSLVPANNSRGWSERVWNGTGSGCSAYVSKPRWQTDQGCSQRTVTDVAAVADPATGVAVYDSALGGWNVFGGTSVSSPIIAAVYALAGNASAINAPSYLYGHSTNLQKVTSGSNGSCSPAYLCNAIKGYNGPSGLGTPWGTGAF